VRIPSGVTDQYIYFVAVDSADFTTRETGLASFTVYRSRNGGAAAAMTTPTINETDATNMPGVYELLLDEDMTIDAGDDSQEMVFHITHTGMAPVTRTIELYRPKITAGNTLGVASDGDVSGNVDGSVASVAANGIAATSIATGALTAAKFAAGAIDAAALAADAVAEISDGVWDEAQSGHVSAGSFGEIATEIASILADTNELQTDNVPGLIAALNDPTAAAIADAVWDEATAGHVTAGTYGVAVTDILADTAQIGAAGAGLSAIPWNASWDAEVQSEVDDGLVARGLHYLVNTALPTGWTTDVTANSALDQIADDGTGVFDRTTDSLQAIRDRGDAAWTTGGGGSLTQALNTQPVIPTSIDLAGTATVRLGLILVNALDDLPSTAEITPGTISIHRKAIGGTTWSAVVTDAAMSEQAGMVYYDEVFDSGSGYAEGDSIRITFKSVAITADANTHEVCDANGIMFQTEMRQTMRGTDSAALASVCTEARLAELDAANLPTDVAGVQTTANSIEADTQNLQSRVPAALVGGRMDASVGAVAAGAITAAGFGAGAIDAAALAADAVAEISDGVWDEPTAGHVTAGTTGVALTDILADTAELQTDDVPGLIAALNDPTAATVAAAVWDALQSSHVTAGSFGEIATEIAAILADTNELQTDDVPGLIAALNDVSVANILAGTVTELASVPAASPTLAQAIAFLYMAVRNKRDTTASSDEIHNAAGSVIGTATVSDDAVTFSKTNYA